MTEKAALEIVWRNPNPRRLRQRWEQINQESGTASYVVKEFVLDSIGSFWATTASLEVVRGGRVA